MNLLDRILAEPELLAEPPVLVDVGAAGGTHPAWRKIARHSIGIGFEPDAREAAPLGAAQKMFKRWIFIPGLAVPTEPPDGKASMYLTRSPQCSSTLRPLSEALDSWAFAELFEVVETRKTMATTLATALRTQGLARVDWLKCDTQGTDLQLYLSVPESWRMRMSAVEFEPGLIDAYEGETKLADVLTAMASEPFWLADLQVHHTPRGEPALLEEFLGPDAAGRVRRFGPGAPAWVNVHFLRDPAIKADLLDRRGHLLGWICATLMGQHGQALALATAGDRRFTGGLFQAMSAASVRSLKLAMARGLPAKIWRRVTRA